MNAHITLKQILFIYATSLVAEARATYTEDNEVEARALELFQEDNSVALEDDKAIITAIQSAVSECMTYAPEDADYNIGLRERIARSS